MIKDLNFSYLEIGSKIIKRLAWNIPEPAFEFHGVRESQGRPATRAKGGENIWHMQPD